MQSLRSSRVIPRLLVVLLFLPLLSRSDTLNGDTLARLVGYTIVASSNVKGDFEGADYDKPVALDNGMIFEFTEYSYTYSYRPTAVVLAKAVQSFTIYKLIVDDEIYDVRRVR